MVYLEWDPHINAYGLILVKPFLMVFASSWYKVPEIGFDVGKSGCKEEGDKKGNKALPEVWGGGGGQQSCCVQRHDSDSIFFSSYFF